MRYRDKEEYIKAIRLLSADKMYIVGAGKCGKILGEYFEKNNIPWEGFIDRKVDLKQIDGKMVYSYEEIDDGYYVISSFIYGKELEEELKKRGITSDRIVMYENQDVFHDIYKELVDWEKYTERIKCFEKKYKGKRCFLIGNGPSLKLQDLEKLKQEYTFASNGIYALYSYTDWRPCFYCVVDSVFSKKLLSDRKSMEMLLNGCDTMFTSILGEGIQYRDDENMKSLYFIRCVREEDQNGHPPFSVDCSKQVYAAGTVTYDMLQLAIYMGFEEIYLLGIDFNYTVELRNNIVTKNDVCNHMPEIEKEEQQSYDLTTARHGGLYLANMDMQLGGYLAAKDYADAHGVKIYNATRGGKLEVFERVEFDELFD